MIGKPADAAREMPLAMTAEPSSSMTAALTTPTEAPVIRRSIHCRSTTDSERNRTHRHAREIDVDSRDFRRKRFIDDWLHGF
jgi:hypothetical protein